MSEDRPEQDSPPNPWDPKPLSARSRILNVLLVVILFPMSCVGFAVTMNVTLSVFDDIQRPRTTGQWVAAIGLIALSGLGFVVPFIFSGKTLGRLRRKGPTTLCGDSSAYFTGGTFWRSVRGRGNVWFEEGRLILKAEVGPDYLWPVLAALALALVSFVIGLSGGPFFILLPGFLFFVFYNHLLRDDREIIVTRENLGSIECRAPWVRLRFSRAPMSRLTSVRFFLNENVREAFFLGFDRCFPGMLDEDYRKAAERAAREQPDGGFLGA
jgi:hypothetical protein